MTSPRESKSKTAASPLNCCQSNDSLASVVAVEDDVRIYEAMNNFVKSPKRKISASGNNNHHIPVLNDRVKKAFPKREPVDLRFDNVTFTASQWIWNNGVEKVTKQILHGLSGEFESGTLSAIMGPSGAGKSTLLNGLAGYITKGFNGSVKCNDEIRDGSARFKKLIAYIPQDEELRLSLTVMENMMIAADLKLGYSVSSEYKIEQIVDLLQVLGLERCHHTMTSRLSGGQRKRLAIALELLSNPPILFLDEPTTGLDSLSCSQCIALLKKLARDGRTVICTIHQPSALIFEMFDHLYVLAQGKCIYDGTIPGLLPQLSQLGLQCPNFHNPADFLMEVAIGEYGTDISDLAELAEKCKRESLDIIEETIQDKKGSELLTKKKKIMGSGCSIEEIVNYTTPKPASSLMQFLLLYKRNLMIAKRQYMVMVNRILAHIAIGLLFGYLYSNVGYGADTLLANYVYLYGSLLLVVYTGQMSVTLSFPLEMKILCREFFNRWYKLTPYLLSLLLIEIPFQIACTWAYVGLTYWLTGQIMDYRVYFFVIFCSLGTLCAQSWGFFIGATTPISIAVFIGPVLACLFSVFGFCIRYSDTPYLFRWLYHISYFRAGFHGLSYSIYGLPRPELYCPEEKIYCHYSDPLKFMREMDVEEVNLWTNMSLIVVITFIMHASTYYTIWFKLNKR